MEGFDPSVLAGKPKQRPLKRSGTMSHMMLLKASLEGVLSKFFGSTTLKVQDDKMQSVLLRINQNIESANKTGSNMKLDELVKDLKELSNVLRSQSGSNVNISDIKADAISNFSVQNLDKISLENVKGFDVSIKQLGSVIQALSDSNSLDKKQLEALERMSVYIGQLKSVSQQVREAVSSIKLEVPTTQNVTGNVGVSSLPDSKQLTQISQTLDSIKNRLILDDKKGNDNSDVVDAINELKKSIKELPDKMTHAEFPDTINVGNFPPTKTPLPVTNININPLRGYAKSNVVTLTTTAQGLPNEVLGYRRGMIVYNNGASTAYIGGSDVTVANGMPIPAGQYSPVIDAGPKLIVYGIAAGSVEVRVLEVSNENIGG
jgi:hypothetical protein